MKLILDSNAALRLNELLNVRREEWQYINDATEEVVVTIGFTAKFSFWGAHTPEMRAAILRCIEAFHDLYGDFLKWGFGFSMRQPVFFEKKPRPDLAKRVEALEPDDSFYWSEESSETLNAVGEYSLSVMGKRAWEASVERISSFGFTVPYTRLLDPSESDKLGELFNFCIEQLKPFNARGGLGSILPFEDHAWFKDEFNLARSFSGLYVGSPMTESDALCHGLKSTDWLNYVSPKLAECLGGLGPFLHYCGLRSVDADAIGEGVLIRSAPVPFLGGSFDPPSGQLMRTNAALRPLRWGGPQALSFGSDAWPRFDPYLSDLWVRRFDSAKFEIWPPAHLEGLPREVEVIPPKDSHRRRPVASGTPCAIPGRYGRPGSESPELVLLKDDVAPFALELGGHGKYLGKHRVGWHLMGEL